MSLRVVEGFDSINLTAGQNISNTSGILGGFFVTSGSPTIIIYDDAATGTAVTLTPSVSPTSIGYYPFPAKYSRGLNISMTGTAAVTFFFKNNNAT